MWIYKDALYIFICGFKSINSDVSVGASLSAPDEINYLTIKILFHVNRAVN